MRIPFAAADSGSDLRFEALEYAPVGSGSDMFLLVGTLLGRPDYDSGMVLVYGILYHKPDYDSGMVLQFETLHHKPADNDSGMVQPFGAEQNTPVGDYDSGMMPSDVLWYNSADCDSGVHCDSGVQPLFAVLQ